MPTSSLGQLPTEIASKRIESEFGLSALLFGIRYEVDPRDGVIRISTILFYKRLYANRLSQQPDPTRCSTVAQMTSYSSSSSSTIRSASASKSLSECLLRDLGDVVVPSRK